MLASYVVADLVRNPRRTLSAVVGVALGVGLFCGVLFFVDGLSASMTARAVAPLAIDIQRIVTVPAGGVLRLTQQLDHDGPVATGDRILVRLEVANPSDLAAHEVTVRSLPDDRLAFVPGSALLDSSPIDAGEGNPLARGPARMGYNLGTLEPGTTRRLSYLVEASADIEPTALAVESFASSRESPRPVAADVPSAVPLDELALRIARVPGVDLAEQLSLADLGSDVIAFEGIVAKGRTRIFGLDAGYAQLDPTVDIVEGAIAPDGVVISVEAADALGAGIGDTITVALPDATTLDAVVTGIADLSRSRSLFSSRRGGDLETFIYVRLSVIVSPAVFADGVQPAFERAASARGTGLTNPPIREVDVVLERDLLHADPATALLQTRRIAEDIGAVAVHQDYLLDNISNTLAVAAGDAGVAKQLFVFLGLPGLILASLLAAYAGTVLAEAQRREQATLRIRGATRRHLLRMLSIRTALLTGAGSLAGVVIGYGAAVLILGQDALARASPTILLVSAALGIAGGLVSTGLALYITGRRSIDREIDEDRARLAVRPPLWRRARLDMIGLAMAILVSVLAVWSNAFQGVAGSVYFGRVVELDLGLLVLPITVWIAGSLLAARMIAILLDRTQPPGGRSIGRPATALYRRSVGRRPWAIANGAAIVALIVALATCLEVFTASYDVAKSADARYALGSDVRITPTPNALRTYGASDAATFLTDGISMSTPVIYGVSNVILRSARTSDPANLAAIDPMGYGAIAPLSDEGFAPGDAATALRILDEDPSAILVNAEMAAFLKAEIGDTLHVLLARATPDQVLLDLRIVGLFERLPGFPDGADALMSIRAHTAAIPVKAPDFFLAATSTSDADGLARGLSSLQRGPAAEDALRIESRATVLARDQSSLAALNLAGLADLDAGFSLAMTTVAIAIFVFGLLLQRRREYVTLRAQGLSAPTITAIIAGEAGTVALGGVTAGLLVGMAMGYYFVGVLRPLFVLDPAYSIPLSAGTPVWLVAIATLIATIAGARIVNRLAPTELLRDD